MSRPMVVSSSPHIRGADTTRSVMRDVLLALCPALIAAAYYFGGGALIMAAVCVVSAVAAEYIFERANGREVTVGDYSAAVTGLLLALNLPSTLPYWIGAFGSVVAIIAVKQLFGGIGQNFANPAITARIVLLLSFAGPMTTWASPPQADVVSGATPLAQMAQGQRPPLMTLLLGSHGGSMGETCAVALLLGGIYLLVRKVITWHIPVAFIGTVFVMTTLFGQSGIHHILSGGLLLGAVFMATDYSTSPPTELGKLVFGVGCGVLTALIRVFGNYPEGVSYAILLMNIMTPHISSLTMQKPFGGAKS